MTDHTPADDSNETEQDSGIALLHALGYEILIEPTMPDDGFTVHKSVLKFVANQNYLDRLETEPLPASIREKL